MLFINQNGFVQKIKQLDQRLLYGGIIISILILALVFINLLTSNSKNGNQPHINIITPTRFILHNSIKSLNPSPGSVNAGIYATVSATFNNSLTDSEKLRTSLSLNPQISGEINWTNDNKTISFSPTQSLNPNKTYEARLIFTDGRQSWQFTITSSDKVSKKDALRNQMSSDIQTAEALKNFYDEYPWWDKFPIKTDRYFVYFNPKIKKFIGLLYPKKTTNTSIDIQVSNMQKEIQATIRNLNINIEEFNIEWKITPEP